MNQNINNTQTTQEIINETSTKQKQKRMNWEIKQVEIKERSLIPCYLMTILIQYGYSFKLQKNKKSSCIQDTVLIEEVYKTSENDNQNENDEMKQTQLIFSFEQAKQLVELNASENYKRNRSFIIMMNWLLDAIEKVDDSISIKYSILSNNVNKKKFNENQIIRKRKIDSISIGNITFSNDDIVSFGEFYFNTIIKYQLGKVYSIDCLNKWRNEMNEKIQDK